MRILFLFILFIPLLFLQACSKSEEKIKESVKTESIKKKESIYYKVNLEILKLAFDKGEKYCSYSKEINTCLNILHNQKKYFSNLECDKMLIYKAKCYDKKNFYKKKCDKVKNKELQKKCYFNKKYDQAIKNKDKSFCNRLPRIKQKECFEKIK